MKSIGLGIGIILSLSFACQQAKPKEEKKEVKEEKVEEITKLKLQTDTTASFTVEIPTTGRYKVTAFGNADSVASFWVEDYINNKDGRTYNITGKNNFSSNQSVSIDGSPLAQGTHDMKVHIEGSLTIDSLHFELLVAHRETPKSLTQQMEGGEWSLVWSDEFDGSGLPDTTKWNYNIGDWGWGNNELQYYTANETKNARQEDGNLIIEAHKNTEGEKWTSARLTTQGKVSFTYGRIEFRAKVPTGRGSWAAGWLLGDEYRDEISWPYCGEIDVLECVGFEIDDASGEGLNHATCHTRAYYFKQGNQIGSEIEIDSMHTKFHTYAVEWYPNEIKGYLDGEHYYTYDKNANELEWPFNKAQNIIINLAIGGGWGGLKGVDSSMTTQQYVLDYVRVYEKK